MAKWQIKDSHYVVNDRWLRLRADTCLTPEGHLIEPFYVLEYGDWVNCVVIDADYKVMMVRQYRHGVQKEVLEIIGGAIDVTDQSARQAVEREVKEELGYVGGEFFQTGVTYSNPANHTNKVYSFLAVGGRCSTAQNLEDSETLSIQSFTFDEAVKLFTQTRENQIVQSLHTAAFFLSLQYIKQSDAPSLIDIKSKLHV